MSFQHRKHLNRAGLICQRNVNDSTRGEFIKSLKYLMGPIFRKNIVLPWSMHCHDSGKQKKTNIITDPIPFSLGPHDRYDTWKFLSIRFGSQLNSLLFLFFAYSHKHRHPAKIYNWLYWAQFELIESISSEILLYPALSPIKSRFTFHAEAFLGTRCVINM